MCSGSSTQHPPLGKNMTKDLTLHQKRDTQNSQTSICMQALLMRSTCTRRRRERRTGNMNRRSTHQAHLRQVGTVALLQLYFSYCTVARSLVLTLPRDGDVLAYSGSYLTYVKTTTISRTNHNLPSTHCSREVHVVGGDWAEARGCISV